MTGSENQDEPLVPNRLTVTAFTRDNRSAAGDLPLLDIIRQNLHASGEYVCPHVGLRRILRSGPDWRNPHAPDSAMRT